MRALIGGMRKVIHTRLYRGAAEELVDLAPQMTEWALSYETPPATLRRPRRRARPPLQSLDGQEPAERILRALADAIAAKGYPETTVADVVTRAGTSQRTFYEHFADKEEATLAARSRSTRRRPGPWSSATA